MLEVKNIKKCFKLRSKQLLWAVNGVSFNLQNDDVLGVVGESGCGKSTLGRLILRLIEPSGGQIFFNGEEITAVSRRNMRTRRKTMQMVFQNPFASFNPKIRIGTALMEVCRYYGLSESESHEKIEQHLTDTGLSNDLLSRWPRELSGGQLQRLAITRAILSEPSLLVADEPLASLDVSVQAQLLNLFGDLRKKREMMMIFISHDMNVVEYFCDKAAVMYMGSVMELIPASSLAVNAMHPYTRTLRASAPRLDVFKDSQIEESKAQDLSRIYTDGCPFALRCSEAKPQCTEAMPELREVSDAHWVRCFNR